MLTLPPLFRGTSKFSAENYAYPKMMGVARLPTSS